MRCALPKFKKGQSVQTINNKKGVIEKINLHSGEYWFLIDGQYYSEQELSPAP